MIAVFDRRVREEVRTAASWLDEQQAGLGHEFFKEVQRLVESIESNPLQFGPVPGSRHQDQLRVGIIGKFGYTLIFKVLLEQELVLVISAQHGHRRPGDWRVRLDSFSPEES